eukprot:7601547-Pyramimonas_sp.AAC.1
MASVEAGALGPRTQQNHTVGCSGLLLELLVVQPIPVATGVAWATLASLPHRWGYRPFPSSFEGHIPSWGGGTVGIGIGMGIR